jgi:toluene monooxygenase system ferredoxin subunit
VLLVNVDGRISAFEDRCAHLAVPLSEGKLEGGVLVCRAHEWRYDALTGESINPRGARLRPFPVLLRDGKLLVDVGRGTEGR